MDRNDFDYSVLILFLILLGKNKAIILNFF